MRIHHFVLGLVAFFPFAFTVACTTKNGPGTGTDTGTTTGPGGTTTGTATSTPTSGGGGTTSGSSAFVGTWQPESGAIYSQTCGSAAPMTQAITDDLTFTDNGTGMLQSSGGGCSLSGTVDGNMAIESPSGQNCNGTDSNTGNPFTMVFETSTFTIDTSGVGTLAASGTLSESGTTCTFTESGNYTKLTP